MMVGPSLQPNTNGSWNDEAGMMLVSPKLSERGQRSTAGHELQHFAQNQEGFAVGGSPSYFAAKRASANQTIAAYNDLLSRYSREIDEATTPEAKVAAKAQYDAVMDHKLRVLVPKAQIDPMDHYRRLAGEVEARNVQTRLDMDPVTRRATPPWATQDVPDEEQIIRFR